MPVTSVVLECFGDLLSERPNGAIYPNRGRCLGLYSGAPLARAVWPIASHRSDAFLRG